MGLHNGRGEASNILPLSKWGGGGTSCSHAEGGTQNVLG